MTQRISAHSAEEYASIIEFVEVFSIVEYSSTTFVFGKHPQFGEVTGISNLEECFLLSRHG